MIFESIPGMLLVSHVKLCIFFFKKSISHAQVLSESNPYYLIYRFSWSIDSFLYDIHYLFPIQKLRPQLNLLYYLVATFPFVALT